MDRIEALRMRIALYRRYLREGVPSEEAARYLRQLQKDQAELALLAGKEQDPKN